MFKKTQISLCAWLVISGACGPVALAQDVQRVEVTGSAIKRTTVEGPAPVEVITRKQIERSGATTINELLKSISSMDIYDQGELTSNSPAGSGAANIRMRGLAETDVLILLNGRRLPVNGIYDASGAGAAFDINSLPLGAIERIDIMKDGGSAIYGADAVAGVVNFITKTDYQGVEMSAGYGVSSRGDGTEKRAGLASGFGDLNKDGYNFLFGLDVFKRNPIYRKDRSISKSSNFERLGSQDGRSLYSPTGNVYDPSADDFVKTYRDCPASNLNGSDLCVYDVNASTLTAYNGADRASGLAIASFQLTPDIKASAELTLSTSKDKFYAHPIPSGFLVPLTDESLRQYEVPEDWGYGTDLLYVIGRFMQGGPRITERKSDFANLALGLEGFSSGYDWKFDLSHGRSKVKNSDSNYFNQSLFDEATLSGQLDPTSTTNDQALVDSLKVRPYRLGNSQLTTFNALLSADAFKMPGGAAKYAVGVALNRESLKDTPDDLTQQGLVMGSIQQSAVDASRSSRAVFAELQLPISKTVEAQLALRHDAYSSYSASSPKVAVKFTPNPALAFRASYAESFKAPALKQLFGAQEEGAITITNPEQCAKLGVDVDTADPDAECQIPASKVSGANKNLKPEKAKTFNLGTVFEVGENFSASIDWWRIKKTNQISEPLVSSAIDDGLWERVGGQLYVHTNLLNVAQADHSGVDLDARYRWKNSPVGALTFRNNLSYFDSIKSKTSASDPWDEFVGTYQYPRYRNVFVVDDEFGDWGVSMAWRTVGKYWDTDDELPVASGTRRVGTHEEMDLQVQYGGFKSLQLTLGVNNVLNRMPPFSATNALSNEYSQQGFAELYSSRGRFFYVSGKYAFR